ncbi:MAG TPA: hypothetical protein VM120_10570 [Bryobacteraceae bacterium]|nr:hypothetical protein [Bryobacteraceae bacterium]
MQDKQPANDLRANEDEFFFRRDRELIEASRIKEAMEKELQAMSTAAGIADKDTLRDLRVQGFNAETVNLIALVPLVFTAWADGSLQDREPERVLEIARGLGVEEGTASWRQLARWLEAPPPGELLTSAMNALRRRQKSLSAEDREKHSRELIKNCTYVAASSGGFAGFGSISAAERRVIEGIAAFTD